MAPNPKLIEDRFKESLHLYVEKRYSPGGFLTAVLSNNLSESIARGDETALDNLPHIVSYIYNKIPSGCWGSRERVDQWLSGAILY